MEETETGEMVRGQERCGERESECSNRQMAGEREAEKHVKERDRVSRETEKDERHQELRDKDERDAVEIFSCTWTAFQVVQSSEIHKDWQLTYF